MYLRKEILENTILKKSDQKLQKSIPSTKVQRTSKFLKTGIKVGRNYVKHYAKKLSNSNLSKDELHNDNAKDIYDGLSELKGSALKVAQMMSMEKTLLPNQYAERFQMAQYSAPPLSYPLVVQTFKKSLGKSPLQLFDSFEKDASNAASIGQVHQAFLNGKKLAVKVQYPGVAKSVESDLNLVKPFASRVLEIDSKEVAYYMEEVKEMLFLETDYENELKQSLEISMACKDIPNTFFPTYYKEFSSSKVLTMDWIEGLHLKDFLQTKPSQQERNKVGQALWDFYNFQVHNLFKVHADPHPGNFFVSQNGTVGIIDFGCVKIIPKDFYTSYFNLLDPKVQNDDSLLKSLFYKLNFIHEEDSEEDKKVLFDFFKKLTSLLGLPHHSDSFDFGNSSYVNEIYEFGSTSSNIKALKKPKKPRGSKHGLYLNRTYFGLYSILHDLKAVITTSFKKA